MSKSIKEVINFIDEIEEIKPGDAEDKDETYRRYFDLYRAWKSGKVEIWE